MVVLKPEPERGEFKRPRGVEQMLVYQKTMFDHYYCIKCILSLENFGKALCKLHFCIPIMARKSMPVSSVLKTTVPE